MAGIIWSLHAKSQSQIRGAESRAERAHGAFLGHSLQDPIVYKLEIRVRACDIFFLTRVLTITTKLDPRTKPRWESEGAPCESWKATQM